MNGSPRDNEIPCTCGKVSFCPKSCDNRLPDRDECLDAIEWFKAFFAHFNEKSHASHDIRKIEAYIRATPLISVDTQGRKYCTCENQSWDMSRYSDIAQAAQDADAEAQLIPVPSQKQCNILGVPDLGKLLEKASYEQRQEVEKVVPGFRDKITRIVSILIRKL